MAEHATPAINELITRIDQGWFEWISAVDRVGRRRREISGVCGPLTVKDLMAHIAFWEGVIPEHIQRSAMGLNDTGRNIDKINNAVYLANKDRPIELIHVEMFRAHQIARDAVLGLKTKPKKALLDRIAGETWDHYPEHTEQILTWLAAVK